MSPTQRPSRRALALLIAAPLLVGVLHPVVAPVTAASATLPCPVQMRLLVIAADGNEAVLPAIRDTLDYVGTPYDVHIAATPGELTAAMLSDGACLGYYQGIMLTTAELGFVDGGGAWGSALTPAEWATLRAYQANFKIRQVSWYAYPQPQFGYNIGYAVDTSLTPLSATLTPEGAAVFTHLNAATSLAIRNAYTFLATPLGAGATPLLTTSDGHALGLIHESADGREHLSLTFDGNQHLVHTIALGYGLLNWVTRGVFLGERRVYMSPQVDDLMIHNDQWKASTPCGTPFENTGFQHRVTAADMQAVLNWQLAAQSQPATRSLRLSMAFNGYGATAGAYLPDDLTPFIKRPDVKDAFHWVSHTFTHQNLDNATAATTRYELTNNNRIAAKLDLPGFTKRTLVTPEVSGLANAVFLKTAYKSGVRYLVSDTSRVGYSNPSPNTGIVSALHRGILMIPRYPNNLFYNVATPDDWTAEYNCIYNAFWKRDLTYDEIVDLESDRLLTYLLKGDANPWMFHQPNLDAYDGTNTLLTNLLSATIEKYNALYTLPILSPTMQQIGNVMIRRAAYNASGVRATWNPDGSITLTAVRKATVPITGAKTGGSELYGEVPITYVTVGPRFTVTIRTM